MCTTCGCHEHHDPAEEHGAAHDHGEPHTHHHQVADGTIRSATVTVETDVLSRNNRLAAENRALFRSKGVFVLNMVSSPGSGKTAILERTLRELSGTLKICVIEGDQQTDNDAARIAATGVPVKQVNTGAGCHLDAHMICHAVGSFDLERTDLLMIENVGNLVCPASFDLGEHHKVVVLSVTEGEDKPLKYPLMFKNAELMLLNKIDLLPYVDFDRELCKGYARRINPGITIIEVSSRSGEGMSRWYQWLNEGIGKRG